MIAGTRLRGELFCGRLAAATDRGGRGRAAGGCGGAGAIVARHGVGGLVGRSVFRNCSLGRHGGRSGPSARRQHCVSRSCVPSRTAIAAIAPCGPWALFWIHVSIIATAIDGIALASERRHSASIFFFVSLISGPLFVDVTGNLLLYRGFSRG